MLKEKFFLKNKIYDSTSRSALLNLGIKPISMILGLVYTPLLLAYLGTEKFGLWATILSVITWINYADIGIGQGLRNLLSIEIAEEKFEEAKRSVSTAYIVLTVVSIILLSIIIVMIITLNWNNLFSTEIDMRIPLLISFVFICINFVLALVNTLLYALQISEYVAIRNSLVQVINIVGLLFLNKFTNSSLVYMSILFGCSSLIIYISNSVQLMKKHKFLKPSFSYFDKKKISEISNVGIRFFIIQLAGLSLFAVDNLLVTNLFGAEEVTPFGIADKVFNTAYAFLAAIIVPYWSKTSVAISGKNFNWIKTSAIKLNLVAIIFGIGYAVLAFLFKPLARLWMGQDLNYQPGLIVVMCIYYILYSVVMVNTQFINGTGKVNGQLIIMVIMGVLNIPLSIYLSINCGLGVVGIKLASVILMGLAAIYFPINLFIIIKNLEKKNMIL